MMLTTNKADIIELAMQKASLKGSLFNVDPTTSELAGRVFEVMMPTLESKGIYLGWIKDKDPMSPTIDNESGLPDWSIDAVSGLLANKLYMYVSAVQRPDLAAESKLLERSLYSKELTPMQNDPYMPRGAGNRIGAYSPAFQSGNKPITVENDGNLDDLTLD